MPAPKTPVATCQAAAAAAAAAGLAARLGLVRRPLLVAAVVAAAAGLAACGSSPSRGPGAIGAQSSGPVSGAARYPERDGPEDDPPPNLMAVPDAQPRLEVVRVGGPNKPYEVLGRSYVPALGDPPMVERGLASWYGRKFHGRPTATGERYDMYAMTAAHPTMPLPSYARVRNPANGREVVVRVNDRGPFHSGRVIDLSYTAALKLGLLKGVATVEVERITQGAIRSASWRRPEAADPALASASDTPAAPGLTSPSSAPVPSAAAIGEATAVAPTAAPWATLVAPVAGRAPAAVTAPDPLVLAAAQGSRAPPAPPDAAVRPEADARPDYWLQLGAFSLADGAVSFRQQVAQRLDWLAPLLTVFSDARLHRLQAGPYASRGEAMAAAKRLRQDLQLLPALVERR